MRRPSPTPSPIRQPRPPCLSPPSPLSEPPPNRFASDFVPTAPPNAGPLVHYALSELVKPRVKIIPAQSSTFTATTIPNISHHHTIDDGYQRSPEQKETGSTQSPTRPALVDVFYHPAELQNLKDKKNQATLLPSSSPRNSAENIGSNDLHILNAAELRRDHLYAPKELADSSRDAIQVHSQSTSVLCRYDPDWQYPEPLEQTDCSRKQVPMWNSAENPSTQLLCLIQRLTMCIGDLEPFFCTLAVYDLRPNAGRVSENFHFDLNNEEVLTSGLSVWRLAADEITLCRNALFTIPDRHPLVFLVLRIERILQGDPEEASDPYLKEKGRHVNELDKISKRVRATINRLSDYRQSFGVAIIPLFSETGELIYETPTYTTERIFIEKQAVEEAAFIDQLREYYSLLSDVGANLKKKVIPNTEFAVDCYLLDPQALPPNRVDPSLIPLKPPAVDFDKPVKGSVREVQYLPLQNEPPATPYDYFVNSLYVYPIRVQFQKYRNIACKIELRLSDASVDTDGVKTFFGKSSQAAFCSSQITQVSYHNRTPTMLDEMKLMLPLTMTDSVHLFFTFYHISCQKKIGKPTEEVIGFSIFPLFKGNMLAPDGLYSLAIASRLPDHYIGKFEARAENANIHFRMQTADCFQIRIRSLSCLFCTDSNLNVFIAMLPSPQSPLDTDEDVDNTSAFELALDALTASSPTCIIQYLAALMSFIFSRMAESSSSRLQYACFCALDIVVQHVRHQIDDGSFRSYLIAAYVQHRLMDDCSSLRCASMLQRALHHLASEENEPKRQLVVRNLWFWLDCIVRVATFETLRSTFQHQEMYRVLSDIIEMVAGRMPFHRSSLGVSALRTANSSVALFVVDLFTIMDKQWVVSLISLYFDAVDAVNDSVLLEFKMRFIEIIFDCSSFAVISGLKTNNQELTTKPVNELLDEYPLQALLVRFIEIHCDFQEKSIRGVLMKSLRKVCTKLDRDASLSPVERKRLSASFLPLLQSMGDRITVVKNMVVKQRRDVTSVLTWIITSTDSGQLADWVHSEDAEVLQGISQILCLALEDFDYIGLAQRSSQTEFESILAPETCSSLFGVETGEIEAVDLKTNIEVMMGTLTRGSAGPGLSVPVARSPGTWASPSRPPSAGFTNVSNNGSVKLSLRQKRAQMATHGSLRHTLDKNGAKFVETVTSREGIDLAKQICNLESGLTESIGASCLRWIVTYISVRWPDDISLIEKDPCDLSMASCHRLLQVISSLFGSQQPIDIHQALFPVLRYLLYAYGQVLLRLPSLSELTTRILIHCTSTSVDIRSSASSMLYWIAGADLAANRSLEIFLSIVTESVSNLVEIMSSESAQRLSQAFRSIPSSAIPGLKDVVNQTLNILADTREIARQESLLQQNAADGAMFEDLLFGMAQAYSHLPAIRIRWLQRLADHCNKRAKYAEAAQALLTVTAMIVELYAIPKSSEPRSVSVLCMNRDPIIQSLSQWENNECFQNSKESHVDLRLLESDQANVNLYDRITQLLLSACQALDRAQLYERCNYVYRGIILPIMEHHQDFTGLSTAYLHLHSIFTQLVSSIATDSRLLGSYYRITFFGDKNVFGFDARECKQFVYKMPKITRLPEVVEYMKLAYSQQLRSGQVIRIWPDSGPIDLSKIADHEQVIQVTFVTPYMQDASVVNFIDRNCDLTKFFFSTPFTVGENNPSHSSDITKQQKRNTIVEVKHAFPALVTRQAIINTQEVIMSPVESATENVHMRILKLRDAVQDRNNIDRKVLTSLLQGSVMLQVHGGTKEIALAFFSEESAFTASVDLSNDPKILADLERLKQTIIDFVDVCDHCIEVYGSIIGSDNKNTSSSDGTNSEKLLHAEFDKHLRTLRSEIMPLLKSPKSRAKRAVRFQGASVGIDSDQL